MNNRLFNIIVEVVMMVIFIFPQEVFSKESNQKDDTIIITEAQIRQMNVRRITDVLNQVPGVNAGEKSVSIRGSYKVKVLLDGRPINDPTSSHGFVKFDLVSLENVERIEIYRGKGALRYGDDASGGVILIFTKKSKRFNGNIKTYFGEFDTSHYSADLRAGRGSFGMGLSLGYEYTDGYQVNGDKEKKRAGIKLEYMPKGKSELVFSMDYLKDDRGLSGRPEYPTPYARKQSEMYSFAIRAKAFGFNTETFLNDAETKNRDPERGIDNSISVKRFGQDLSTLVGVGKYGKIGCGVALRWGQAEGSRFGTKDEYSISLFGVESLSPKRLPVTFSFGLRGSYYSDFKDTINPEARISYKRNRCSISLNYTRTNNTPSFYQRYDRTSTKDPNPDLDMETADNLSLSLFYEISKQLSCGMSVFYNRITDRIAYVLGDNGVGRYENFGEVSYKGYDISIKWKIIPALFLKTTYTYLEAINEDTGLWMVAKPRHRLYMDLCYRVMDELSIIFNLKYASRQFTRSDNRASVPDRTIGDLRFRYSGLLSGIGIIRGMDLFGEIRNIGDKTYCYGDGWLAPPRTWILGLSLRL